MSDRKLEDLTLHEQMVAWLRNQNPRARYVWLSVHCACAQFAAARGLSVEWEQDQQNSYRNSEWSKLNKAAMYCTTFGALLKSLTRK